MVPSYTPPGRAALHKSVNYGGPATYSTLQYSCVVASAFRRKSGRLDVGSRGEAEMKVRTSWIVVVAGVVVGGALAQRLGALEAAGGAVEGQQPPGVPSAAPTVQAGDSRPLHVYIRTGLKSHGEGAHDYPQFSADWSKLLTDHGALVDGSMHFPSAQELANTDVMLMYEGDAGYMTATERSVMEDYLKRGGGLVSIHETLCGDDPQWYIDPCRRCQETRRAEFFVRRDQIHDCRQGLADHEGHVGF